jgi:hypothetical protein
MAVGRGVNTGVDVFVGVGRGVFFAGVCVAVGVAVRVAVGDGGGPSEIVRAWSLKPGPEVVVEVEELPPVQLRKIAPKTNNTTGETTSHLSHRDINIEL